MYKRVKIKKGDTVKVIAGGNKGKTGTVMQVLRKDDRVIVENVNMVTKHVKPSPANPQGGIEKKEAPIHISNVMVVDGDGNATRVGRRRGDDGQAGPLQQEIRSNAELMSYVPRLKQQYDEEVVPEAPGALRIQERHAGAQD